MTAPVFLHEILGWRGGTGHQVANVADKNNATSKAIASELFGLLGVTRQSDEKGQTLGKMIEESVEAALTAELPIRQDHVDWQIQRGGLVSDFAQYRHLARLHELVQQEETLRADLGADYLIRPDVTIGYPVDDLDELVLHAAISCKFTIRSDRVQNIRHEGVILARHRRGRLPHIVSITAEPMPTRLASIARGTGEVDKVYHLALDELKAAVHGVANNEQREVLDELVDQDRLAGWDELLTTLCRV